MDEIDLELFDLIAENPRCSYRDMADKLDISTPAVHRRIQAAREQNILIGPIAMLNNDFARAVGIMIWGHTWAKNHAEVMEALKEDDCSQIITMMSGKNLLIRSYLKDLKDLDKYVNLIREKAMMPNPVIGLSPTCLCEVPDYSDVKLTKVDLKIMSALHKDGRMSVSDISEMIKVSPKTVRNHLGKILEQKVIGLMTIINQAHSGQFVPFIVINLEKGVDKRKIMVELKNDFSPPLMETFSFSNQLDMLVTFAWLDNMARLKDLQNRLEEIDGIDSLESNIFIQSCGNNTWMENIIADPEEAMIFLKKRKII